MTQLTIGHLAERAGVATSAIRFYESKGLIASVRTTGNQRRYEQSTLRRIAFIRTAQRVGLTLEEIGEALATLPDGRTPTKSDWHRLSLAWRPRLDEQIERIERLRDRLDSCIGCGCLSLRTCALSNPDDEAGHWGTGAVFLEPRQTTQRRTAR
jgi:MerR family transcriptional regulator, redox-sensitive transcriptional activator SoxR